MPKIKQLYAWVMEDGGPDDEGVPASMLPGGMWFPLMGANIERMDIIRPLAQKVADETGKPVRLLIARELEEMEVLQPHGGRD